MSAQDPLSRTAEALRAFRERVEWARDDCDKGLAGDAEPALEALRDDIDEWLARLDVLPAPVRIRKATLGPKNDGWFYPDAPVARDDGGET